MMRRPRWRRAGLGVGIWDDLEAIEKSWVAGKTFHPAMSKQSRIEHLKSWADSIQALKNMLADRRSPR